MKPKHGRFGLLASSIVTLSLTLTAIASAASGTWTNTAGGSWPTTGNWSGGVVADGVDSVANFSTLDISANATVTLDAARTVGALTFADAVTPSNSWTVATGTAGPLTLSKTSGVPSISVTNQTATISAVVAGTQGLEKTGAGVLALTGVNTYTGTTTVTAGTLSIAADTGLGTAPGAATAGSIVLNGGKLAITANTVTVNANRGMAIGTSGGEIVLPNGSQTSTYNGIIAGVAGTGALTFSGNSDIALGGANTYTGGTVINSGRVKIGTATGLGTGTVTINGVGGSGGQVYTSTGVTLANNFILSGFGGNDTDNVQRGALRPDGSTINGTVTLAANAGIDVNTGTGTINGVVSGAFNLTINKADAGTVVLAGNNTYSGGTTLSGGTLRISGFNTALGTGTLSTTASATLATASGSSDRVLANPVSIGAGTLSVDAGFAMITLNGNITGPGAFTVTSTGPVLLAGTNTYAGATTVANGYLLYGNAGAISTAPITVSSGGALVASGPYTTAQGWLDSGKIAVASAGTIALATSTSDPVDFATGGYNSMGLSSYGDVVYSGTITPGTGGYKFGSSRGTLTVTQGLSGSFGLTKVGASGLILAGSNSYTGATSITGGQVIVTGSLANTAGFSLTGGSLVVSPSGSITGAGSFTVGAAQVFTTSINSLGDAGSTIDLTAGTAGTGLVYLGAGETTDRIIRYNSTSAGGVITNNGTGPLIFTQGATAINTTADFGITMNGMGTTEFVGLTTATTFGINFNKTDTGTFTLNGLTNLKANGTNGNFRADGGNLVFAATSSTASGTAAAGITRNVANGGVLRVLSGAQVFTKTANVNSILGGWALFDDTTWAVANGNATAITGLATFSTDTWAAGANTNVTLAGASPAGAATTNSLRFNEAGAKTLTLTGVNVVTSGGILVTSAVGSNTTTITGGTSVAAAVTNGDVIVHQMNPNGKLVINTPIAANGSGGFTKAGPGTVDLGATNLYTGTTYVTGGILNLSAPVSGNNGVIRSNLTVGQGAAARVTVAVGLGLNSGARVGSVNLAGGTLDIQNTGNNAITSAGITMTAGTITGMAGAKLDFRNNGAGDSNIATVAAGATSVVSIPTVGLAGANWTLTTASGLTSTGIDLAVSSAIIDDAGSGGGGGNPHNVTKAGPGTLMFTGANTYTGSTTISAGTLILGTGGRFGTGPVVNNAQVTYTSSGTTTLTNAISGTGNFLQSGSGTTIYAGTTTYTGTTTISSGTLQIGNGGTTGTLPAGAVVNNSTLAFNRSDTITLTSAIQGTGGVTKAGSGTLTLDYTTSDSSKLSDSGPLTLTNGTLNLNGGTHNEVVLGTEIRGNASITRTSGSAVISLGQIFHYAGTLDIAAGGIARTDNPNVAGVLPFVTINGDPAMNDGTGLIVPAVISYTDIERMGGVLPNNGEANVRIIDGGLSGTITAGAGTTDINSITVGATSGAANIVLGASDILRLGQSGVIQSASGSGALTISGGILTAGGASDTDGFIRVVNDSSNPITIASAIANNGSGIVSLDKYGTGNVILSGANTATGIFSILEGGLQVGAGGTTGTLATASSIVDNGSLTFFRSDAADLDLAGVISGSGSVTYQGTGTVEQSRYVLNNASTYTGGTTISNSRATISNATGFGTGPVTVNNGGGIFATAAITIANPITLAGTGWLENVGHLGAIRTSAAVTVSAPLTLAANSRVGSSSTLTLPSTISAPGFTLQMGAPSADGGANLAGTVLLTGNNAITSSNTVIDVRSGTFKYDTGGGGANLAAGAATGVTVQAAPGTTINMVQTEAFGFGSAKSYTLGSQVTLDGATFNLGGTTGALFLRLLSGTPIVVNSPSQSTIALSSGGFIQTAAIEGSVTGAGPLSLGRGNSNTKYFNFKGSFSGYTGNVTVSASTAVGYVIFGHATGWGSGSLTLSGAGSNVLVGDESATNYNANFTGGSTPGFVSGTFTPAGNINVEASSLLQVNNRTGSAIVFEPQGTLTVNGGTLGTVGSGGTSAFAPATGATWVFGGAAVSTVSANVQLNNTGATFQVADAVAGAGVDTTISGIISGSNGLTKTGVGTLSLTGANTYAGNTTVNAGTLSLATPTLNDASTVNIAASGATLDLVTGTDVVDKLFIGGVQQISGTWGSLASSATNKDARFTGTGILSVTSGPVADPYGAWLVGKGFTAGVNDGKGQDADNDGHNNLFEFAFDDAPLSGKASGKIVGKIAPVTVSAVTSNYYTLTLPVRATATTFTTVGSDLKSNLGDGIYYFIQGSLGLTAFDQVPVEVTGAEATAIQTGLPSLTNAGWTYRTFRLPVTVAAQPKAFIRAKISE